MNSFKKIELSSIEARILLEILFLRIKFNDDPAYSVLNKRLSSIFHKEFQESFESLKKKMLIECYNDFYEIKVKITPLGLALIRQLIEHNLKGLIE